MSMTVEEAIDLLKRTQQALKENGNLRLHKVTSNKEEVMNAFGCEDLAKDLKGLDFEQDNLPMQRSLGLYRDLSTDSYTFRVSTDRVGHSRRDVLSLVNSVFDPLGFAAPVTLQGKLFLRHFLSGTIDCILNVSSREQWSYISTEANPADSDTRCLHAGAMQKSTWLLGPTQLHVPFRDEDCRGDFPLVNPHNDNEVRPTLKSMKVTVQCDSSLSSRFEKFSSWRRLVEAVAFLQRKARLLKQKSCAASSAIMSKTVESFKQAEDFVIKQVQHEQFFREIDCLKDGLPLPKNSRLLALTPFVDGSGIVRVGGRLNKADIPSNQKNPIILPGNHHVSCLLFGHHNEKVKHQGRHFTEGAVRAAGLWIIGGKRLVSSIIQKCVICRKFRGRQML